MTVFNLPRNLNFCGILPFEIHPFCSLPFQHSVYEIRPFLEKSYFTLFHWTEQRSALVMLFYLKTFCSIFSLGNTLTTLTQLLQNSTILSNRNVKSTRISTKSHNLAISLTHTHLPSTSSLTSLTLGIIFLKINNFEHIA